MVGNGSTFSDAQWQQYLLEVRDAVSMHIMKELSPTAKVLYDVWTITASVASLRADGSCCCMGLS
jgi:hypothetical protein